MGRHSYSPPVTTGRTGRRAAVTTGRPGRRRVVAPVLAASSVLIAGGAVGVGQNLAEHTTYTPTKAILAPAATSADAWQVLAAQRNVPPTTWKKWRHRRHHHHPSSPTTSPTIPTSPTTPSSPGTPTDQPTQPGSPSTTTTTSSAPSTTTTTSSAPSTTSTTTAPAPSGSFAQQVVDLTNAERADAGCKPLTVNSILSSVAQAHSADMAAKGYFSHTSQDGRSPFDRMHDAGYAFSTAGENIAAGQATPASVMTAWMNSSGHKANILNCSFTQIGVGYATGGPYGKYWTQDFGTPVK